MLVLLLRSDVVHSVGGETGGESCWRGAVQAGAPVEPRVLVLHSGVAQLTGGGCCCCRCGRRHVHHVAHCVQRQVACSPGAPSAVSAPPPPPPSPNNTHSHVRPASPASPPADVSFQAYSLLRGYLQHFPYASLRYHEEGQWAGRPYVAIDEGAAWEPLAANR